MPAISDTKPVAHTATAMVSEFKLPIYLGPAANPCTTAHGTVEFVSEDRLTVRMRDLLDVIFSYNKRIVVDEHKRLTVLFDATEVAKILHQPRTANKNRKDENMGNGKTSVQGIKEVKRLLEKIKKVSLRWSTPQSEWGTNFSIIDEWGDSLTDAARKPGQFGSRPFVALGSNKTIQSVKLKKIVFTIRYSKLFLESLQVCINKAELLKILSLESLFTRSMVRLFFSHSYDTSCGLIKMLAQMGIHDPEPNFDGTMSESFRRALRRYRKILRDDTRVLGELGFYSNDDWNTICWRRPSGVFIHDPLHKIKADTDSPG